MDATPTSPPSATLASTSTAAPAPAVLHVAGVLAVRPLLILVLGATLLAADLTLLYANALIVLIDLIALAAVALALGAEGRRLRDLFGPWRWSDLAWGALFLLILVVGFFAATFVANLIVHGGAPPAATGALPQLPLWAGLIAVFIAPASIALSEEVVYRGYAQPRLQRHLGPAGALILVAVVFGVQHAGFALTSAPDVAARVLTTLLAGLVLGGLWLWLRRLMPLVLAHWGLDLLFLGLPTLMLALS